MGCTAEAGHISCEEELFTKRTVWPCLMVTDEGENPASVYVTVIGAVGVGVGVGGVGVGVGVGVVGNGLGVGVTTAGWEEFCQSR